MQPACNGIGIVTMKQFNCKPQYAIQMFELNRWEMPPADINATIKEKDTPAQRQGEPQSSGKRERQRDTGAKIITKITR